MEEVKEAWMWLDEAWFIVASDPGGVSQEGLAKGADGKVDPQGGNQGMVTKYCSVDPSTDVPLELLKDQFQSQSPVQGSESELEDPIQCPNSQK